MAPETEYLKRYALAWTSMYDNYKKDPADNDRLFHNAPCCIVITSPNETNAVLASSNMELMTDALGLGTYFNGFFIVAAKDNKEIYDFLNIDEKNKIVTCMVIGYPDVVYKRTVPRKKAEITWM